MAVEEEPAAPSSIKDRITALKLSQVGNNIPGQPPPTRQQSANGTVTGTPRPRPPPPPRPDLPARPNRPQSPNVPLTVDNGDIINRPIGNQPEASHANERHANGNGMARPPLPPRTSTQSSQASLSPALPPRRPSGQPAPSLPPRRPSEAPSQPDYERSRRGSTDSMSSIATTRSSLSGVSNATSLTSMGDRRVKAPEFDPSSLPALPPKRTKEEKEAAERKYAGMRPLRQTKSSPKVQQVAQGTTPPPPARQPEIPPPVLPNIQPSYQAQAQQLAIRAGPKPARAEPPPPPRARPSALSWGMNKSTNEPPPLPEIRTDRSQSNSAPPPIPTSSKPAVPLASKPKMNSTAAAAVPSKPVEINSPDHLAQIIASSQYAIVDFYADYCGPCKDISPTYDQLCSQRSRPGQITFAKVNRPAREDCYSLYGVRAMPTLLFFKNGSEVQRQEGANQELLKHWVGNFLTDVPAQSTYAPQASARPLILAGSCLHCRDFSGPDNHAARFPRQSVPSLDVGWLAHQLTSPFPSLTDKARVVFTWLHHNIAYDTEAFFGNNVKPSTPQSTLQSGLAVCEGYAGLFTAIAMKAGLESVVIGGGSKGYGHTALKPGEPIPPFQSTHAWNAVKIDNGEWKLIDCCWGAGSVNGPGQGYNKRFAPERFTQTNNEFGLDHYPEDSSKQLRTDGRIMSWEEFILGNKNGCGADFFAGYVAEEGLDKTTFQPASGKIALSQQPGPTVRFAFQKICPHWDPVRCGQGPQYLYILHCDGLDGTPRNHIPFETNGDVWWCDVPVQDLGRPGQKVEIFVVKTFGDDDGRGLTIQSYRQQKGRVGYSFGGVCKWAIA
ncbi:Kyphoscoliosis peptidase [Lecanosticta acicola]|uniref:Kyphoscoliosis peptidase n=1 Tax=Lecanosticta acicola TaxID=111012 RepID=A0AAI9E8C4_9PEZI|nr:Kyphoscoliosis peptidase [Lecanosticta acicola]